MKKITKQYLIILIIVSMLGLTFGLIYFNFISNKRNIKVIIPLEDHLTIETLLTKVKLPDSIDTNEIQNTLANALNARDECRKIVSSEKVTIQYKSGKMNIATFEDDHKNNHFIFSLIEKDKGKIVGQCHKKILSENTNSSKKEDYLYILYFYTDKNNHLKTYRNINGEFVYFFPSGSLEDMYYKTADGKSHSIIWAEDGTILRHDDYYETKIKDPLIIEAEEKAKQKLKEFQENAQKEYLEYQKKMGD